MKMADESSLPESLKKLEIDAQSLLETEAESTLKSLTLLGDECPRVTCQCNTGTRSQPSWAWNTRRFTMSKTTPAVSPGTSGKSGVLRKGCFKSWNQRGKSRLLREPILKLSSPPHREACLTSCSVSPIRADSKKSELSCETQPSCSSKEPSKIFGQCSSVPRGDFGSLLPNNSASLPAKVLKDFDAASYKHLRCSVTTNPAPSKVIKRKKELRKDGQLKSCSVPLGDPNNGLLARPSTSQSTSCSQQARMVGPSHCDDVTIDELASYFDLFVHIPRKMSHMAENMYI